MSRTSGIASRLSTTACRTRSACVSACGSPSASRVAKPRSASSTTARNGWSGIARRAAGARSTRSRRPPRRSSAARSSAGGTWVPGACPSARSVARASGRATSAARAAVRGRAARFASERRERGERGVSALALAAARASQRPAVAIDRQIAAAGAGSCARRSATTSSSVSMRATRAEEIAERRPEASHVRRRRAASRRRARSARRARGARR